MTPYMQGWDIEDLDFQRVSDNLQITKKLIRSSYSVNLDVFLELAEQHLLKSVLEYLYMFFFFYLLGKFCKARGLGNAGAVRLYRSDKECTL